MAAAGACTKVAAVRGLLLTPLPPLMMQIDVESWAPSESGAGTVAGGCTKVAQSVAQLLLLPLLPPSLPSPPTPSATAGGWGREGGTGRQGGEGGAGWPSPAPKAE